MPLPISPRRVRNSSGRRSATRVGRPASTGAERMRALRARRSAPRANQLPISGAERMRRSRANRASAMNQPHIDSGGRDSSMIAHWEAATVYFNKTFRENNFGYPCSICDRLWFKDDIKKVKESHYEVLERAYSEDVSAFVACRNCYLTLNKGKLPTLSTANGFEYPPQPDNLPELDPITTRLVSPRIPFMSIRRLRRYGSYSILGQVINIPVDVNNMVKQLPRQLDDDYAINVSIKRNMIHKSSYISGHVKKRDVKQWLEFLEKQPLYRTYGIRIDWSVFNQEYPETVDMIDDISQEDHESEFLAARQHTLLWNEDNVLDIAPGQNNKPLNIIYDDFAEEFSFPQIYCGVGRRYKVHVTPYMMANSETRRQDRRGVTPEHVLYMAMKILRLRVVDGVYNTFKCVQETEGITRRMLEDREFLNQCVEMNLSFLKSIPNSAHYWSSRKKDLFAMLKQLGKPTAFLTISASETKWPDLLRILHKLSDKFKHIDVTDPMIDLDVSKRCHLVNEDPVTCCIYFHKLVDTIMKMISLKRKANPFGKYRVIDFFKRIEFQHRGSPHAHILLWLENDPKEEISEDMPGTIQLVTNLCSVSKDDIPPEFYPHQVHNHTFTCTKRGEKSCRFGIPFWPVKKTCVLLPMAKDDQRLDGFKLKAEKVRQNLETKNYDSINSFLDDNHLDESSYLNVIRSTIGKPTLLFRRGMDDIMTNTFHPWIASVLNSNMDLQFILDAHSCAAYVVDYVNKSNRGTGNLHRELIKLGESHPEMTYDKLIKKLGLKILNTVEMSAQEAAWYLLRQPMSQCSRDVVYIPTCRPCERQKSYKRKSQIEKLDLNSTDIWTKGIIQKYEERPEDLKHLCLADFAAWYSPRARVSLETSADDGLLEEDDEFQDVASSTGKYYKRKFKRIVRSRQYDVTDITNFKREMVTLYVPFSCENVDILDRNKFLDLYNEKIDVINAKRQEYEAYKNFEQLRTEYQQLLLRADDSPTVQPVEARRQGFVNLILGDDESENIDDFNHGRADVVARVRKRTNIMEKQDYCEMMRTTNQRQRELVLEVIHRLKTPAASPIQIFFTGPAGCGKTYTLIALMETFNRYSQEQNQLNNSYIACASTGKAAVNLGGITVHSAFQITQSRRSGPMARESIHRFRQLFSNVRCIIIDEVSMVGSDVLHKVNSRLQEITGELDEPFGGMNMIFCGDFRQLPPVLASPVYRGNRNHLEGALLWQSLDFFALTQVMRQSDIIFSSILTKIGDGQPLSVSESQLIESRFRTYEWCEINLNGVVRLYHQNHQVDEYNSKAMHNGTNNLAFDACSGYSNNEQLESARSKLHRMSTMETGGLLYNLILGIGYPYMLTTNVDVEDKLVNGAIGILKFVENLPDEHDERDEIRSGSRRVWMEFPDESTGATARIKNRSTMIIRRGEINERWTPISVRSVSISLGGTLKCRRVQFPLSPACAITIHKSQGGTFDKAVILYDKSQQNQLVYVALSRVTSIEGLYLINTRNDFTFHHKRGSSSPSVREIRDEYSRLERHQLPTLARDIEKFKTEGVGDQTIIICTINSQSLVAHFKDIDTDKVITDSDILAVTETWMPNDSPVTLDGFELVIANNNSSSRGANQLEHANASRTAGGVAIYRKIGRPVSFCPFNIDIVNEQQMLDSRTGDASIADVTMDNGQKFSLCVIYIHPRASRESIKLFISGVMNMDSSEIRRIASSVGSDDRKPLIVTGDFNVNVKDDDWLVQFMESEFDIKYVDSNAPTTLGNTHIDLTFVRDVEARCMPYVCYFSYHRPLFTRASFVSCEIGNREI